ncbi:MAG: TIGR03862 family flavoprotein [Rhizomicrobium sp.]|nr:TIGR03862 family flavoprotein [Rhizomicrobium sp.]
MSQIAVIGGGPAGLRAAELLAEAGHAVTLFDQKATLGRKFLLAGRGGLNLTHSEPVAQFLKKYGPAEGLMARGLALFSPKDLSAWCHDLGFETFVGTSGRVFPKAKKATPLLRAWLKKLDRLGVRFAPRHRWTGWQGEVLSFHTGDGTALIQADATVIALGGASWPHLGSDGHWAEIFRAQGIALAPFRPANCGFVVEWSEIFRSRHAGEPLKPVTLSFAGRPQRGEIMITQNGLEGSLIYAFGAALRDAIETTGKALITLDLRPDTTTEALTARLARPRGSQSLANHLRKAGGLSPLTASLLREGARDLPSDPGALAARIKAMPLSLIATGPIARAISTSGGVRLDALSGDLMLKAKPGVFVIGEMLDWEAPTGGYLLQGCFSTAALAVQGIEVWLKRSAL